MTDTAALPPVVSSPPSGTVPVKRVAIFAATSWEMGAVRAAFPSTAKRCAAGVRAYVCAIGKREYWLIRTGVGLEKAGQVASRLLTHEPFHLALSTGFACALIKAEIGALLVGRDVLLTGRQGAGQARALEVPGAERDVLLALAERVVQQDRIGMFVSTDRIVGRASEKQDYAHATGAIGLDMESAAVASEARRAQVPFVIVRAVSDLLDEDLPLDFNLFLRPTGWLKGLAAVLGNPSSLVGLGRLRRQSQAAAKSLTAFFRRYAAETAMPEAGERSLASGR